MPSGPFSLPFEGNLSLTSLATIALGPSQLSLTTALSLRLGVFASVYS
jgi:hypothetical protein